MSFDHHSDAVAVGLENSCQCVSDGIPGVQTSVSQHAAALGAQRDGIAIGFDVGAVDGHLEDELARALWGLLEDAALFESRGLVLPVLGDAGLCVFDPETRRTGAIRGQGGDRVPSGWKWAFRPSGPPAVAHPPSFRESIDPAGPSDEVS